MRWFWKRILNCLGEICSISSSSLPMRSLCYKMKVKRGRCQLRKKHSALCFRLHLRVLCLLFLSTPWMLFCFDGPARQRPLPRGRVRLFFGPSKVILKLIRLFYLHSIFHFSISHNNRMEKERRGIFRQQSVWIWPFERGQFGDGRNFVANCAQTGDLYCDVTTRDETRRHYTWRERHRRSGSHHFRLQRSERVMTLS